ncbi:MAG: hypothetical protein DME35_11945 [Verrucomicrobia bacterium]|nr:MAG: hypothetical protein DME35_11945 [Verrucomicrobiota bacterium]
MKPNKMTTVQSGNSVNRSRWRRGFLLIPLLLGCFGLSPVAQAVLPAPDGGYPGSNTAEGEDALLSLTLGFSNTAIGYHALYSNTTGGNNTALGFDALLSNTTSSDNTAVGFDALLSNTTGFGNTANGYAALQSNTTADGNTANGYIALSSNTTGIGNTATGYQTLIVNTTGERNTANGIDALFSNTTGSFNTATGGSTLASNTTGGSNTANGANALINNTTGNSNTANGLYSLQNNTTGSNNIALGSFAGTNLTIGDNNIDVGNAGVSAEANTIRIGTAGTQTNAYMSGIYQTTVARGLAVVIDSTGHLGTKGSSERFKDAIKPMDEASEAIHALKPVTFHYKKDLDPEGIPQFGLVAEEVAKVNPDLVARDDQGKIYTVRYDAVNAMLLNEFLKEHRTVQELKSNAAKQEATIAKQQTQIEALISGLQKVSDQLELSKPAPRTVKNNQ